MARIVIGAALSVVLLATGACSGSSPSSPSASPQSASPSTTAFSAQRFDAAGVPSSTLFSHDHPEGEGHGRESQLEGTIVSIDAVHHSFVVRTTTVNVLTSTEIRHGDTTLTFADLKVGDQVHVKGAPDGAAIAAREVKVQNDDRDEDHDEAEGVVAGLTGACPAITFTLGATTVTTSATTEFRHGTCAQVVNGASVEVKGARQADGSILASRVSLPHEEDDGD